MNNMLYIYGAGACGIHICRLLRQNSKEVCAFIDKDKKKHEYMWAGLRCIAPEALEGMRGKDEIEIIVCVKHDTEDIAKDIMRYGIKRVYTMQDYEAKHLKSKIKNVGEPICNVSQLKKIHENFCRSFYDDDLNGKSDLMSLLEVVK